MTPLVSIVILNWNGLEDTRQCLHSLIQTVYENKEIIVVDNGSIVNEKEILEKKFDNYPYLKFYRLKQNLGFTGGHNWASKKTRGKYLLVLNNDTKVTRTFLGPLVSALENDRTIIAVQPKVRLLSNKEFFDYAGAAGGFVDQHGYPFTQGRIFDSLEKDTGQYDKEREIFWASGVAMFIRRDYIKKVGGLFDKALFNYMEEIDFCWRSLRAGFSIKIIPSSIIYHKVAGSARRNLIRKRMWEHRNNLIILTKHAPLTPIEIFQRLALEIASYFLYLFKWEFKYVLSLIWAHTSFIKEINKILVKRRQLKQKLPIKKWEELPVFRGSIALEHFFLKRKYFWELNWPKNTLRRNL